MYNGSFEAYTEAMDESDRRKANATVTGAHVKWNTDIKTPVVDIDLRARMVLHEIDRAANNKNEYMSSDILQNSVDQMFPTPVLRIQLEEELDFILSEQIKERERGMKANIDSDESSEDEEEEDDDEDLVVDPNLTGEDKDAAMATLNIKVTIRFYIYHCNFQNI